MTRLLALTLAALALAVAAGCGGSSATGDADDQAAAAQPETAPTAEPETAPATTAPETAPASTEAATETVDEAAAEEITTLVEVWYAEADPAVCDRMTHALLDYGWMKTGDAGRAACRKGLEAAAPVEDVEVGTPEISGETAVVVVAYTLEGNRQRDGVELVLRDGEWRLDGVVRTG
jgi:hypothetical protein